MRTRVQLAFAVFVSLTSACVVDSNPASDIRGNYDIAFDDKLTVTLDIGGAKQVQQGTESDTLTFQINGAPVQLDLATLCAKPEVKCPSETLWNKVSVDQPNIAAQQSNSHVVNVIDNRVHDLPAGQKADTIGGLVDQNDNLTLLVGGDSRGQGDCGLLALSVAKARFTHQGDVVADAGTADADGGVAVTPAKNTPVTGLADGTLEVGFLGACAFGPAVIGATLDLKTGFTGTRSGALDPPPFTPVDPSTVPVGTEDAGPASDAGIVDGGG